MYEYRATVVSVYDGDTFRADVDLGFGVTLRHLDFRMLGLNAPEMRIKGSDNPIGPVGTVPNPLGVAARDALAARILGQPVIVRTMRDHQEKYGRWLATVFLVAASGEPSVGSLNEWMVANGLAVPFMTGGG